MAKSKMTKEAAERIKAAEENQNDGTVEKKGFAERAEKAAEKNKK